VSIGTRGSLDRVETERMVLERLLPEHGPALTELMRDPRVGATMWPAGRPPTDAELADQLAGKLEHWEGFGFGIWLLRDRNTGAVAGRGGLQNTLVTGELEIEAAWLIVPERWGRGLATELAHAALRAAFDTLGLLEIVAFTLPHNIASRRVMEKTGFVYEREIEHVGLPHMFYRRRHAARGAAD
jgi:ribosomal-protein-alanine N-acetyltransferase